jgi:Lrp/AsnC family transcriptional regulator for asnA, asnC and gidA
MIAIPIRYIITVIHRDLLLICCFSKVIVIYYNENVHNRFNHIMSLQGPINQAKIDEIDLKIIEILTTDGRTPFAQIAKRLGVSTGMIRQRYHHLVQDGVLQIVAVTNPLLMGFTTMAHIGVKVNLNRLEEIADEIASFEEVVYLVLVTGSYDLCIEVVCRDNEHLIEFLTKKLHAIEGVKDTETFLYLRIAKEIYNWSGVSAEKISKVS